MADEKKAQKAFMVCQSCGTLFRLEVGKTESKKPCVKCGGGLAPLKGDVPHDQIATVLFLRADETGPQVDPKRMGADPGRAGGTEEGAAPK